MESRTEMSFKMSDSVLHPNLPLTVVKEELPPKKATSKKSRKKSELSKEVSQPKEESEPFFTTEKTNG